MSVMSLMQMMLMKITFHTCETRPHSVRFVIC